MLARWTGDGRAVLATALGAMVTLLLAAPAAALAQDDGERPVLLSQLSLAERERIVAEAEARATEAAELMEEAREAEAEMEWRRAAGLYRRSGELRTDADVGAPKVYALAGRAFYFGDRPLRASRMWERSGDRALSFGDVAGAARGYLRAALAAQEAGEEMRANRLGWKAHRLSESPALTRAQREMLRMHLKVGNVTMMAGVGG